MIMSLLEFTLFQLYISKTPINSWENNIHRCNFSPRQTVFKIHFGLIKLFQYTRAMAKHSQRLENITFRAKLFVNFQAFLKTLLHGVRSYARTGIVAEGVEEERELRFVHEMGISLVQGYFYGEPRELQEPPADSLAQEDVSAMAGGEPGTQARA